MNLLFSALLGGIAELARAKGVRQFRVDHKRNAHGELVVALIIGDLDGPFAPDRIDPRRRSSSNR